MDAKGRKTAKTKEQNKLKKIFIKYLSEDEMAKIEKPIESVAFMWAMLYDLQQEILENGAIDTYQNGMHQSGRRVSPHVKEYNAMVKNYNSAMTMLLKIAPAAKADVDDGFDSL